jgi:tRNA A37 threonylcarbamoyladenosine synthetase subunit TsaC/SUA5/YrdC
MLKINRTQVKDWDVAVVFDNGPLKGGARTTVVEVSTSGLRIVREGAISRDALSAVAPSLSGR